MPSLGGSPTAIGLDVVRTTYHPGDFVEGTVHLQLSRDAPVGKVVVRLVGYTKSKIVQANGQSKSEFKGRTDLFEIDTIVHDGHFTHKSGSLDWQFKLQLPHTIETSTLGSKWRSHEAFLDTTDTAQTLILPPSFRFARAETSRGWHAFTTYVVEVTMTDPGEKLLRPKIQTIAKAIRVVSLPPLVSIDQEDPRHRRGSTTKFTIKTLRLMPEHATGLSFMQKTKSVLRASALPRFTFDLDISYPSIIQAYHSAPIPFIISATPRTDPDSTTMQPEMRNFYRYPSLFIRHFRLSLQAITQCRCPSIVSDVNAVAAHEIVLTDRSYEDKSLIMRSLAWDQKNEREDDLPVSLDLGRECGIHLTSDRPDVIPRSKAKDAADTQDQAQTFVTPSFKMFNVSRSYRLVWKFDFTCAGEKIRWDGTSPEDVTVLGQSSSGDGEYLPADAFWIVAPDDDGLSGDDDNVGMNSDQDVLPAYSELPGSDVRLDATAIEHIRKM